jgi:hypothetical protein
VPADLGDFYVFKDEAAGQEYLASRYRRRTATPRKRLSEVQFEENRQWLEPFMATIARLGRLPELDEYPEAEPLLEQFEAIDEACRQSKVGKLLPNALYVHRSALESLEPILRVYEGCGRAYLGEIAGANLIKLHRFSGKISYLVYPDFETDPNPALLRSVKLNLRSRQIESLEYASSENPPVLHRKETFLEADHPLHTRFARLTQQEEKHGLLDETASIGNRQGWQKRLDDRGLALQGHRLVKRPLNSPDQEPESSAQ